MTSKKFKDGRKYDFGLGVRSHGFKTEL